MPRMRPPAPNRIFQTSAGPTLPPLRRSRTRFWRTSLQTYADIAKFKDQLDRKLYGIESGSGANGTISKMISDNTFGLSGFKLVEASEQAMLAETAHRIKEGKPVVFFGWQPHPMNVDMPMVYLQKGNDVFGPNDGGATVVTLTRAGYAKECPKSNVCCRT
jgi:glycine betaine/proline transport system substrate-binding protein